MENLPPVYGSAVSARVQVQITAAVIFGCLLILTSPINALGPVEIDKRLDMLFGSHRPYEQFLVTLKESIAAKNWRAVAAMVAYPIKVEAAGHQILIRTPDEFLERAEVVLTAKVIKAVESQSYASLFANQRGVMIGEGDVWFSSVCGDARCLDPAIRITAINP